MRGLVCACGSACPGAQSTSTFAWSASGSLSVWQIQESVRGPQLQGRLRILRARCAQGGGNQFSQWKQANPSRDDAQHPLLKKESTGSSPTPVRLPGRPLQGKQTMSPPGLGQFRPPPLPGYGPAPSPSGAEQEKAETRKNVLMEEVRERIGSWQERAGKIVELQKFGVTAEELYDATYVTSIAQTTTVVAAQVYDSLVSSDTPEDVLTSFDESKVDVLYALRILSVRQRKAAAEFIVQRNLAAAGAQELAKAIKEHERRPQGREGFSTAPGDCLAYMLYQAATESKDASLRKGFVERALCVVTSQTVRWGVEMSMPKMEYRNLGRTGIKVSVLGYGAWVTFGNQLDVSQAKALLSRCRDFGVNFFDNAEVYANGRAEEIMGQAIKDAGWKRSDLVISTKIFWGGQGPNDKGLSRKHLIEGLKASLKRLDMEYVDLLYAHRPDPSTPMDETVRAMTWLIDRGYAFYWGTSEWSAQQVTEAWDCANRLDLIGPAVEQPEYNLLNRDKVEVEFQPLYRSYGIGLTTWSPLGSGVLTGKYTKDNIPPDSRFSLETYKNLASRSLVDEVLTKVEALRPIAKKLDMTMAQLAIAWCIKNPHVNSVITGATKESQVIENMNALEVVPQLTPDWMEKIDHVMGNKPQVPNFFR